jgi:hypothetical protein
MKNKSVDMLLRQLKELEEKVIILSRHIETLSTAISASSVNINPPIVQPIASIDEEFEDEPCEVLTSFLEYRS